MPEQKYEVQWQFNPDWGSIRMLTIFDGGIIKYRKWFTDKEIENRTREIIEKEALRVLNA